MSGICGLVSLSGARPEPGAVQQMARAASHRGPDGINFHSGKRAALAHLALDITPEDTREVQPLTNTEADITLVADARIDNRGELAGALRLSSEAPDAQLILAAYEAWGERCAERLVGDFAFAVWDGRRGRLYAARDAMGMRGFHYRLQSGRVWFGTEAAQVQAAPGVEAALFEPAIAAYLVGCFGPLEWSFYEGISQLPPAHALSVGPEGSRVWRYWEVEPEREIRYADDEEYVEHFLEVYSEAVRCRLRSARPVGLFLSGGVDSGAIASSAGWLMSQGKAEPPEFRAYSWAFEELSQSDERHVSSLICGHYGFPVTEVLADEAWPLSGYPDHGPHRDEPYIGVYQALLESTLLAARRQGTGLMLSGDRGDLMVGDAVFDHLGLLRAGRLGTLREELEQHSRWLGMPMSGVVRQQLLKPALFGAWPEGVGWAQKVLRRLRGESPEPAYPEWVSPELARRVGLDEILQEHEAPQAPMKDTARRARYELIFAYVHMRGVVWSERTWSRFGMSFADPWSDRRLAEFVLACPQWRIQRLGEPKRIARRAMRGIMPENARRSAGKIVPYPLYRQALEKRARGTILELLTGSRAAARGYLDEGLLGDHYDKVLSGESEPPGFWQALTLEMWLRRYWD